MLLKQKNIAFRSQTKPNAGGSFWKRSDQNGVSFPEEEDPTPAAFDPGGFAHDEGIVT